MTNHPAHRRDELFLVGDVNDRTEQDILIGTVFCIKHNPTFCLGRHTPFQGGVV